MGVAAAAAGFAFELAPTPTADELPRRERSFSSRSARKKTSSGDAPLSERLPASVAAAVAPDALLLLLWLGVGGDTSESLTGGDGPCETPPAGVRLLAGEVVDAVAAALGRE